MEKNTFVSSEIPVKIFPSSMSNSEIIIEEASKIVSTLENLSIDSKKTKGKNGDQRSILDLRQNIGDINPPSILHEDCSLDVDSFILLEEKYQNRDKPKVAPVVVPDLPKKPLYKPKPLPPPQITEVIQPRETLTAVQKRVKIESRLPSSNKRKTGEKDSSLDHRKILTKNFQRKLGTEKPVYRHSVKESPLITRSSMSLADTCNANFSSSKTNSRLPNHNLDKRATDTKESTRTDVLKASPNLNRVLPFKSKLGQRVSDKNTTKPKINNHQILKNDTESLQSTKSLPKGLPKVNTQKTAVKLERNNTFIMEEGTSLNIPIVSSNLTEPKTVVKGKSNNTTSLITTKNFRYKNVK